MAFWRQRFGNRYGADAVDGVAYDGKSEISDGSIKYVGNQGNNNTPTTYQDSSGAPVESNSPLGYTVSSFTILFLNINMMIGTGIFSTRK
jgi:hypothetical protein